ncbi:hypothetical protein [Rhizobium sp. RM]|uniref:Pepco domain-containing protein n=1 Tax=Rhizobium sp. RM TaxID=2748079 RepID=UPI00110E810A|nr:hypothetical protein [Rhizobium sp. RM]NWJ27155.1 hypothetical protein [Rhizobium sp. RM]TMV20219.1 hypothetical protein BJG94_09325 [Rhizobium sp. Td3]
MPMINVIAGADNEGTKSMAQRGAEGVLTQISSETLRDQFRAALQTVSTVFDSSELGAKSLTLKEISLKFEITVKGEVRLVAAAGAEAKGAIEVKLAPR